MWIWYFMLPLKNGRLNFLFLQNARARCFTGLGLRNQWRLVITCYCYVLQYSVFSSWVTPCPFLLWALWAIHSPSFPDCSKQFDVCCYPALLIDRVALTCIGLLNIRVISHHSQLLKHTITARFHKWEKQFVQRGINYEDKKTMQGHS